MWINFFSLVGGLALLVYSADRFVTGTASIARSYGVSPLLIGLTIVGLGTSAPEILVSAFASWQGNTGLAVGNALGSNIANIGLILGCTALVAPVAVHSKMLKRELPVLMLTSVICYLLVVEDYHLSFPDSLIMLTGLVAFMWWLIHTARKNRNKDPYRQEVAHEIPEQRPLWKAWVYFSLGLIGLLASSRLLVWAAVNIAEFYGVSDLIIGLTIVAFGTSLPELAASITSILKKEADLAIGNVIGSNMYNLLAVYSLPGIFSPGQVESSVVDRDFPVMLALTAALFIFGYGIGKNSGNISRMDGFFLVAGYVIYQWFVFQSVVH